MSNSVTPGTGAHQAPLCMGFPRQEYCSGLPFATPEDLPNLETESTSPGLSNQFFTTVHQGSPKIMRNSN